MTLRTHAISLVIKYLLYFYKILSYLLYSSSLKESGFVQRQNGDGDIPEGFLQLLTRILASRLVNFQGRVNGKIKKCRSAKTWPLICETFSLLTPLHKFKKRCGTVTCSRIAIFSKNRGVYPFHKITTSPPKGRSRRRRWNIYVHTNLYKVSDWLQYLDLWKGACSNHLC